MDVDWKVQLKGFAIPFLARGKCMLREVPEHEPVEQHAKSPNISFEWIVVLFVEQFWGHVVRRASDLRLCCLSHERESQVYDLYFVVLVDEYVVWLNISMRYFHFMKITHPFSDLPDYGPGSYIRKRSLALNKLSQRGSAEVFHHNIYCIVCLEVIYKLDDSRMLYTPHDLHFSQDSLSFFLDYQLELLKDLYNELLAIFFSCAKSDLSKTTFSQHFSQNIVACLLMGCFD